MTAVESKEQEMAVDRDEWAETEVHKASTYSCGKCGERFENPDEFYAHRDAEHPR